jgi:hypothetical protein
MWSAKFCGYKSFGVYYCKVGLGVFSFSWLGDYLRSWRCWHACRKLDSDQWLVSVISLSTFGFGLEFPVRPPYMNWESFYGCCSRINGSIFHNFVWQVNIRLIALGNFRFVFTMCESTVVHPASRNWNICPQSGHIQLKNFQLFKMSWS